MAMQKRQRTFLLVALPLFAVAAFTSLFSMTLSMLVSVGGLGLFAYFYSRPVGRSLALSPCSFCARKIVFEHEGEFCKWCEEPLHAKCIPEHDMAVHAPGTDQPFR